VALVGFPRLQEQIATRLLAELDVETEHIAVHDIKQHISHFKLMVYYWPDSGDHGDHLIAMRDAVKDNGHHHLFVTSSAGKRTLIPMVGESDDDVLLTPIQPHELTRHLGRFLEIKPKQNPNSVDVNFLNPFVEGTVVTLKQMADMECQRTGLRLNQDAKVKGDISGTIGLSGNAEGFVSVSFTNAVAKKIVAKMLMIDDGETVTDADLQDGVGELMNVVAGYAKAQLVNTEHSFQLSIPNVIYGGPHNLGQPRGIPVFVLDFAAAGDTFHVMVCLMPKKKKKE